MAQIGANKVPVLEVHNKIDLLEEAQARVDRDDQGIAIRVWCSAQTGVGMDLLIDALQERFHQAHVRKHVHVRAEDGRLRAMLHERTHVLQMQTLDDGSCEMEVELTVIDFERLLKKDPDFAARLLEN